MSQDWVVVDVEIQKTIEETPGGWNSTDLLGVAVAALWEFRTERMRIYGPDDVPGLRERLSQADRISGFNIHQFDFPVIWGLSKDAWKNSNGEVAALRTHLKQRTDDILRRIWQTLGLDADRFSSRHQGWGLDAVAGATLNAGKIGHGAEAPKWYQAGQVQKVANYCADDVALERDLAIFIDRYGYVLHPNGQRVTLKPWKAGEGF